MSSQTGSHVKYIDFIHEDGGIRAVIPRLTTDEDYLHALERLLEVAGKNPPTYWTIDLSTQEKLPVMLASILLEFGREAQGIGCQVRFAGFQRPFAPREVFFDEEQAPIQYNECPA